MAWDESKAWMRGTASGRLYQALLDDALNQPVRNAKRKKIVHPEEMPWEMSRQGLLKHLLNEQMSTRMETVDAYMQIVPRRGDDACPIGSREEGLDVVEGRGYDLHQERNVMSTDASMRQSQAAGNGH